MDFFQTVGGQALASVLKSSLPRIADGLQRIAAALEKQNETQERLSTVDPDLRHLLSAVPQCLIRNGITLGELKGEQKARETAEGQP